MQKRAECPRGKILCQIINSLGLSVITAGKLISLSHAYFYRRNANWREKDKTAPDAIQAVLSDSPQAGFWKCYYSFRFKGFIPNHKRVYRMYCRLGLKVIPHFSGGDK